MKYMVMECRPSYAILLDEEGCFKKAANLHYEVGQIVEEPVLMRDGAAAPGGFPVWVRGTAAAAAACLVLLLGTGYYQNYMRPSAFIHMAINPKVQMDINRRGTVIEVSGENQDGEALISGYSARGKEKVEAAEELLERAMEMGFLKDGGTVSFAIDAPNEDIFQEYGVELRTEITDYLEGRVLASVEVVNYRESPPEEAYEPAAAPAESRAPETPAPPEETAPAVSVPTEETAAAAPAPTVPPAETAPPATAAPTETAPPATVPPTETVPPATVPPTETVPPPAPAPDTDYDDWEENDTDYRDGDTDYGPEHEGDTDYDD